MKNTDRSKELKSGYYENEVWGALIKSWKGYVIAKNKDEYGNMERYARIIQESQYDLGLPVSSFDSIGMSATSFLWELVQKDNNNQEQHVAEEEKNYLGDSHYERERFTDDNACSEDFRDDYDKADRLTDDNAYRENFTD